jgi:flagellar biosynthetic protein FliP
MSPATRHFLRHYAEMVAAMFLGMAVLGYPVDWVMGRLGANSDAFMFLEMATTMTVPMVAWMMYRGHGRRANGEMSASMFVPTFAVIGALTTGLLTDIGVLMIIEHVAMLLAMAGVMLVRPEEYSHHHGHEPAAQVAPALATQVTA